MINEKFIILGVIIGSIGTFTYLVDTIKGKVKPNRVTWFLWALAPSIIKSWKEPETEDYKVFFLAAINSGITILAIKTWNFAHYAFPLYIFIICTLLALIIKFKPGIKTTTISIKEKSSRVG